MTRNVGAFDKTARLILASVLIVAGFFALADPFWKTISFVVAAVMLITSLSGFCPLYRVMGIRTCQKT